MGETSTVTSLRPAPATSGWGGRRGPLRVGEAVEAFLVGHRARSAATTVRAYTGVLNRVADQLGTDRALSDVGEDELAETLDQLWGQAAPATWNRNRAAVVPG